jgi:hypothetical protein
MLLGVSKYPARQLAALDINQSLPQPTYKVLFGRECDVRQAILALENDDHDRLGSAIGAPACCRQFYQRMRRLSFEDMTFASFWDSGAFSARIPLKSTPETNSLLRSIGLRLISHRPCSPECAPSVRMARTLEYLAREIDLTSQMEELRELLSWPMRWSILHGIAETMTPVFKMCNQTDATAVKFSVTLRVDDRHSVFHGSNLVRIDELKRA